MVAQILVHARIFGERVILGDGLVGIARFLGRGSELKARQHPVAMWPLVRQRGKDVLCLGGVGAVEHVQSLAERSARRLRLPLLPASPALLGSRTGRAPRPTTARATAGR